ncbi:MAG: CvpA family protein [Clostridia bacterium]|nr:CvpA family protein [Clostridia bacterium]
MNLLLGGFRVAFILDIVCVLIFFIFALLSARKGGINCLFGFAATLVSLILAFSLASKGAALLNVLFDFTDFLSGKLEGVLLKIKGFNVDISESGVEQALAGVSLPSFIKDFLVDELANKAVPAGTTLASQAGGAIAKFVASLLGWVVVFFLSKLFITLLGKLLTKIVRSITVASAINTLLGVTFGLFKAFVIVCGVLAVFSLIPSEGVHNFFNSTFIVKYLYNDNPLMRLISNSL